MIINALIMNPGKSHIFHIWQHSYSHARAQLSTIINAPVVMRAPDSRGSAQLICSSHGCSEDLRAGHRAPALIDLDRLAPAGRRDTGFPWHPGATDGDVSLRITDEICFSPS